MTIKYFWNCFANNKTEKYLGIRHKLGFNNCICMDIFQRDSNYDKTNMKITNLILKSGQRIGLSKKQRVWTWINQSMKPNTFCLAEL